MDVLAAYLPTDRLHALARGVALPDRTHGAALFADISGFTPLTEALVRALGPRRGAEELTRQLNEVYAALIAEVDRYGGSVIGFSGDAITCWFDDTWRLETGDWRLADSAIPPASSLQPPASSATLRATACALMMHRAMARFGGVELPSGGIVTLGLKAGVASGPARRFAVGDPSIQLIDVLAGATLERLAAIEHLTHRAEVVLGPECAPALDEIALVVEWRSDPAAGAGAHYPVVAGLMAPVPPSPWPALPPDALDAEQLRPWLLPAIFTRLHAEQGELVTELRPAVSLFLRFGGIAYETDPAAGDRLDRYVRWVQGVLARYEGTLLQLTIGDKGSYLYAAFGAPTAHEDDARRAVTAALELGAPPADLDFVGPVQIGISQGMMRTGAYGGATRRTYGVLGDEVNLAARLMQAAAPGEVLASERVQQAGAAAFVWEPLTPLQVKGRREPVPVVRLLGAQQPRASAIVSTGPLLGRAHELARLKQYLEPIFAGRFAGLAYVYGEAGIGKSRLAHELRQALATQPAILSQREQGGRAAAEASARWFACPAEGIARQSLHPFRSFLRGYFDQDAGRSEEEKQAQFDAILDTLAGDLSAAGARALGNELARARLFLAALVDLRPDGSAYERVEPALRFEQTLAAFKTLVCAESLRQPVIVHVEDAHWLDEDSRALVAVLTRDVASYPFAILVTSRYHDDGSPIGLPVDADVPQAVLNLGALPPDSVRDLAAHVLGGAVAGELAAFLVEKTDGNPFFVEQLALDLRERGLIEKMKDEDGRMMTGRSGAHSSFILHPASLGEEVPASITAVLIARLDRLPAPLKAVVQTAAVLGHEFDVQVLDRMLAGDTAVHAKVRGAEDEAIWSALSDTRYRFRHALLRDAAYEMQVRARLRDLHARAGAAIEQTYGEVLAPHISDLVYHYGQAGDAGRERRYLALLGEQAFNVSAFREALACFARALDLALGEADPAAPAQRARLIAQLARTHLMLGDDDEAQRLYEECLGLAEAAGDQSSAAAACFELGALAYRHAAFADALAALQRSLALYRAAGDRAGEGRALNQLGGLYIELGDADTALACYEQALSLGRKHGARVS